MSGNSCGMGFMQRGPNVFGDAALIIYANLCKFSQNHIKCSYFLISWQILFKFGIQIYYRFKKSPNVFGDAALINYANLCKFGQNHIKCSYFYRFCLNLVYRSIIGKRKIVMFLVMLPSLIMLIYANLVKIT